MDYYETMWTFNTPRFTVEWSITPDDDCDTSFDETGETAEKLRTGEWQCFTSRMRLIHRPTGIALAEDFLGGSIYADPKDFRDHLGSRGRWGSYFSDMVRSVIADGRKTLEQFHA